MNKGLRIVVNILYYATMVVFGVILAIILPMFYQYSMPIDHIEQSLDKQNYTEAMKLIGGYFNNDYVKYQETSGISVVLFESAGLEVSEDEKINNKMYPTYSGFVYHLNDHFKYDALVDNKTALYVKNDSFEKPVKIELLNFNSNEEEDSFNDSISTAVSHNFFYFEISKQDLNTIENKFDSFYFTDSSGNTVIDVNYSGSYDSKFFQDVNEFIEKYNDSSSTVEEIQALDEEFRKKSNSYLASDDLGIPRKASRKATIIVLIYFLCVYIVGDIAIGFRFIIKGVRYLIIKIFKITPKDKGPVVDRKEIFGHDYYSQVTFKADVSEAPDLKGAITIKYSNQTDSCEFSLLSVSDFSDSKRVKAGSYLNPWFEVPAGYELVNAPDSIKVEGYKMDVLVKIIKKDGEK